MPDGNDADALGDLIAAAGAERVVEREAKRFDGGLQTASRPQKFICDDDLLRAVKFAQNAHGDGRAIFAEQIVGRAGVLLDAPVARVELVTVQSALVEEVRAQDPNLGFVPEPGVHHASLWAQNHTDREGVDHVDANRTRFGALEILYAWFFCTGDHQFIYNNDQPREVLSVDHSTFLPGAPDWTMEGLADPAANLQRDAVLAGLGLGPDDRSAAIEKLRAVTPQDIAAIVAFPPDEWGVGAADRLAVASYLLRRRDLVIELFNAEIATS